MTDDQKDDLDRLLDAARAEPADWTVSDALTARIIADAAAEMPRRTAVTPRQGGIAALIGALGGWAGIGGLAAATVAGIWLGISPPDALGSLLGTDLLSVSISAELSGFDLEG